MNGFVTKVFCEGKLPTPITWPDELSGALYSSDDAAREGILSGMREIRHCAVAGISSHRRSYLDAIELLVLIQVIDGYIPGPCVATLDARRVFGWPSAGPEISVWVQAIPVK